METSDCDIIKKSFGELEITRAWFEAAYQKMDETGDITECNELREEIEQKIEEVRENMSFKERREFAEKYDYEYVGKFDKKGRVRVQVRNNNSWLFVDRNNKDIFPNTAFNYLDEFSEDLLIEKHRNGTYFLMDKNTGTEFGAYQEIMKPHEGIGRVKQGDGRYFYVDELGQALFGGQEFTVASPFSRGFAVVHKDRKFHFLTKDGEYIPTKDTPRGDPSEGVVSIVQNGLFYYVDHTGKKIFEQGTNDRGQFMNGYMRIRDGQNKIYYLDKKGKQLTQERFANGEPFGNGIAPIVRDGKCCLLSKKGEFITPEKDFTLIKEFAHGRAIAYTDNPNRAFVIDTKGKVINQKGYTGAESFNDDGVALIFEEGKSYYIDKNGKYIFG